MRRDQPETRDEGSTNDQDDRAPRIAISVMSPMAIPVR